MPFSKHTLAVVEAGYDLWSGDDDWFASVLDTTLPLLDHGLGVAGVVGVKPPQVGPLDIRQMRAVTGSDEFVAGHFRAALELPQDQIYDQTRPGMWLMSELAGQRPGQFETWKRHVPHASDAVGIIALDPDGWGVQIMAALPELGRATKAEREGWSMLAAHLCSGLRLRRAAQEHASDDEAPGFPFGAEAVLDAGQHKVVESRDGAKEPDALGRLREAAIHVDRARGSMRREDPKQALEAWSALLGGRWSLVDWFDSDDRRYVLAIPNPPDLPDPRGLTEREHQVVAYAALGESVKLVAYRLGLSPNRTSSVLRSAMRKLGVKTQAQLVERMRGMPSQDPHAS